MGTARNQSPVLLLRGDVWQSDPCGEPVNGHAMQGKSFASGRDLSRSHSPTLEPTQTMVSQELSHAYHNHRVPQQYHVYMV